MEYAIDYKELNQEKMQEFFTMISKASSVKIILQVEGENKQDTRNLERQVGELLNKLGVPLHLSGYKYLKYSVVRCILYPKELENITKLLYPETAKKYHTTSATIEHGIRNAIKKAWETDKSEEWEAVFGKNYRYGNGKPTNSRFIAALSDYIEIKYHMLCL